MAEASSTTTGGALKWTKLDALPVRNSEAPARRSGHSLSIIGSNGYLFGGCDYAEPPGPTNDLFLLKINTSSPCEWEKLKFLPSGAPPPRWKHSATVVDNKIVVFGGFHSSTTRFNDLWVFNPITMEWIQPGVSSNNGSIGHSSRTSVSGPSSRGGNGSSAVGGGSGGPLAPAPRGGHSAVLIRKTIYVFGGYGGTGYSRRDFDDVFQLRLEDWTWVKVATKGKPPEKRAGHQACAVEDRMLVCGGWNSVVQFNDLHILDTNTNSWSSVDGSHMAHPLPRWNHSSCAVLAIPHAKVFIFGGVLGEANNYNGQGTYMNDIAVLDTGEMVWSTPEIRGTPPCGRSDTTLAYDDKGSRLLVFGGWANVWLNDLFSLDVSCVVGPPYGITAVFPEFGPITGGTLLTIEGIDFMNRPVIVRFTCRKGSLEVAGTYVNDHTLQVVTPDFTAFVAGDVQLRVALQGDSFTTTFQTFSFFSVTHAPLCFAYGPGVLCGGASGETTSFIIQARDAYRGLRTRGGDEFTVEFEIEETGPLFIPNVGIQDLHNGRYLVSYPAPKAGEYLVHVQFAGTFDGTAGPIRGSPFKVSFDDTVTRELNLLTGKLVLDQLVHDLQSLQVSTKECLVGLDQPLADPAWTPEQTTNALISLKEHVFHVEKRGEAITLSIEQLRAEILFLQDAGVVVHKERELITAIDAMWDEITRKVPAASARIAPLITAQSLKFRQQVAVYLATLHELEAQLKGKSFWSFSVGVRAAQELLALEKAALAVEEVQFQRTKHVAEILEVSDIVEPCERVLVGVQRTLGHAASLWDAISDVTRKIDLSKEIPWSMVDGVVLEEEAKAFMALVKATSKEIRECDAFKQFEKLVRDFLSTCPLFQALRHPSMRRRHWQELLRVTGRGQLVCPDDNPSLTFADILALNLHEHQRDVEEITDRAQKEAKHEAILQDLETRWANVSFAMAPYKDNAEVPLLRLAEETVEMLESDQLVLQGMLSGRHAQFFQAQTDAWHRKLQLIADAMALLGEIQRAWSYLEPLFIGSDEVKRELPEDAQRFVALDERVRATLTQMWSPQACGGNVLLACQLPDLVSALTELRASLDKCQQALKEFLDAKRRVFPRFYFISEADLLDLLSHGSEPRMILVHIEKVFLATQTLVLEGGGGGGSSAMATATQFISKDAARETIAFDVPVVLEGKVEAYLQVVHCAMQATLATHVTRSLKRYPEQNRVEWLTQKLPGTASSESMDAAQVALLVAGIEFAHGVEEAFVLLQNGRKSAMAEYLDKVKSQLTDLIKLTQTALSRGDRQRVMCVITMDAHARDVVQTLVQHEISSASAFQWQAQLKPRHSKASSKPLLEICDASFAYGFEYLGNGPRLVVTPLTDRIYVTATQALHMQLGCAPAGPAGTGKTETTKDLATMVGKVCYVFNCSPEMDYKNLGNIFKGLASAGAWGCFDEFNRLVPEVLSVCSVQFKAVCDAVRSDSATVVIDGDSVALDATCGTFVTMNPGYLGRAELPEGLKALFRPITVMAPDLVLICENMLMAEGFKDAKPLASKFASLYALLKELLSAQAHYDWGLRAVKSVLVVAGGFKRAEPTLSEHALLLRALRDFNLPKIVEADRIIFTGLLTDLFPMLDPPRKVDDALETYVKQACEELSLWPHDAFRLKVVQLEELLAIRHCVFLMGAAGSAKTECRDTLMAARRYRGEAYVTKTVDLNPKAVATDELYGYMVLGTREWKDGLLSKLLREQVAATASGDLRPKWLVLDGDLDANWIESMNSVMDDNKTLTLASNERIPLKPNMRLLFEIRDLAYATPATVSRAGILFLSSDDGFQWRSLVASWVGTKASTTPQRVVLGETVTKFVDPSVAFLTGNCRTIVPTEEITLVQTFLYLLDAVVDDAVLQDAPKLEILAAFCSIWAFGGALTLGDDGTDYRRLFSEWWRQSFKQIKLPARDSVFDYWLHPTTLSFDSWRGSPFFKTVTFDGSLPMSSVTVPTPETASISSWMSVLVRDQRPVMLCGPAGTGKTQLVQGLLASVASPTTTTSMTINFNYYTSAASLQTLLESRLVKKMGSTFGPSAGSQLVVFLDDLNLPQRDAYNTQSALALLRQHADYSHWYDRAKLSLKTIQHVQFVSCMNAAAGSGVINPRLQRHFATFALAPLSAASLQAIYTTFLDGYAADFVEEIRKLTPNILRAALGLHAQVAAAFRKTVAHFHYEFHLRHVASVVQGLLLAKPSTFDEPFKFALLWVHEAARVYGDRLATPADLAKFTSLLQQQARKCFPSFSFTKFFVDNEPLLFCHFANGARSNEYDLVASWASLQATVDDALAEYNDLHARMDLVLFQDALAHVARIVRILGSHRGHALLVGVGGSGRKSLARLAVFLAGYSLVELSLTPSYSLLDFKTDLQALATRAGVKGESLVLLLPDSQLKHERMLVAINDLLSSGHVPDLFSTDEQMNLVAQIAPRAKAQGLAGWTDKDACWQFFLREQQRNLHVVLCFSPAGDGFRQRARRFPALVNCTAIDWFQPWPRDALEAVAARFLENAEGHRLLKQRDAVQAFLPYAFTTTTAMASAFHKREKRSVYATPKSFLECIALFDSLLQAKQASHAQAKARLHSGLDKMEVTRDVVANMEDQLAATLAQAELKRVAVEELALRLRQDKAIVEHETARAMAEQQKCEVIQREVAAKKADTESDLAMAQPMLDAAMAALDTLNRKDLGSCKTMTKPPAGVGDVFAAVVVLLAGSNANITVQKNGKVKDKDRAWEACKKALLGNVNGFVDELKAFRSLVDDGHVPELNWKEVRPFLQLEHFTVEAIEKKNSAAAGLCAWVLNIVAYYDAIVVVEPKKQALAEANDKLRVADERFQAVQQKVDALAAKLAALTAEFDATNAEVEAAIAAVERGRLRIQLATRLTAALGSESARWSSELEILEASEVTMVGDVLLAASFVSYAGAFTKPYRDALVADTWVPFLTQTGDKKKAITSVGMPLTLPYNPLAVLTSEAEMAEWTTRGLPSDRVSMENGALVRSCTRWPLLIDPQLQGVYWLREMEKQRRLHVVRPDQANLATLLEQALAHGHSFLVENMGEAVDVALWPVIAKQTTTRGHQRLLKLGDKLVEWHSDFRLYLHTKLSNPHYPPELQAETTLVNLAVTPRGLEDQLLALVVRKEWPAKAKARTALVLQQNQFTVKVKALEDRILSSLADAEGDVTENVQLITDLETTKATAVEIAMKAQQAHAVEAQLAALSAKYASVASRGALLFFLMDALHHLHAYYVYSLNAFVVIFQRGIDMVSTDRPSSSSSGGAATGGGGGGGLLSRLKAAAKKVIATQRFQWNADLLLADRVGDASEQALEALLADAAKDALPSDAAIAARCQQLQTSITDVVFNYIRRGLFERDKATVATQLALAVLQQCQAITVDDVHQLTTTAASTAADGPGMGLLSEWLPEPVWLRVRRLEESVPGFAKLTTSMKSDADEWREWFDSDAPETRAIPGQYRPSNSTALSPMQLLQLVRAVRPDRTLAALQAFIVATLGSAQFVQQPPFDMEAAYAETSASTPMFFVLFPGVDPTSWVETLGARFDYTYARGNLVNVAMGQGQEAAADALLMRFSREGNWLVLQNIHLMPSWLPKLERTLELCSVSADQNFRCFLSAEAPAIASIPNLPESLLQSCIKVANEAPTDLKSNLRRAWAQFSPKYVDDNATVPAMAVPAFQACLFSLCFFHAVVLGRRRFGCQGWSRLYSFNTGDLLICADVLQRYVRGSKGHLPWDDLRYIVGEIMYGGHITDHWDRVTTHAYLEELLAPAVLQGKPLAPGFASPDPALFSYAKYASYIENELPRESPALYGLHANAEVGYLLDAASQLLLSVATLTQTASGGSRASGTATASATTATAVPVLSIVENLLDRLPPEMDLVALQTRAAPLLLTDHSPYVVVALQEASRMHALLQELHASLSDLSKGVQGTLHMTEAMEDLAVALSLGQVPGRNPRHACSWERHAWHSRASLAVWFAELLERHAFLSAWTSECQLPYSMWLSGLFNPAAFLTAIKQHTARRHSIPLDAMAIETHCTTMARHDQAETYPDMGAFIHGLFLEGARWESPIQEGDKPAVDAAAVYEVDGVTCGGRLVDPVPKELFPDMPVVYARAVVADEAWDATAVGFFRRRPEIFECPVYQTTQRGPTYVFLATLHTTEPRKAKWTLAGAALVLQKDV